MKGESSYHILIKSLLQNKKYIILSFFTVLICMIVFSMYIVTNDTNDSNDILKAEKTYGAYDYVINLLDCDQKNIIQQDKDTKTIYDVEISMQLIENREVCVNYVDEKEINNTDIKIEYGKFPKEENEIAVEKWFMIQIGIDSEDIIGKKVVVCNPDNGKKEEKVVSGIITRKYSDEELAKGENGISQVVMNEKYFEEQNFSKNQLFYNSYVIINNKKNTEGVFKRVTDRLLEDNKSVYGSINDELLYARGYSEEARFVNAINSIIIFTIIFMIVVFIGITINNMMDLCIANWSDTISICKILGVPTNKVINIVILIITIITSFGALVGGIAGILIVIISNKLSLGILVKDVNATVSIPYLKEIIMVMVIMILSIIVSYFKIRMIKTETPYKIINNIHKRGQVLKRNKKSQRLFNNNKFRCIKLALRNISVYKWRKIFMILCISFSLSLICLLSIQVKREKKFTDNNNSYSYKINIFDEMLTAEDDGAKQNIIYEYNKLLEIMKQHNATPYFMATRYESEVKFDKKYLSDNYIKKLEKNVVTKANLLNSHKYIKQDLVIMGYSEEMLKELAKKNGCSSLDLKNNEAIFVNRTINRDNTISVDVIPPIGEKYSFLSDLWEENKTSEKKGVEFISYDINVINSVDNVYLYPEDEGNYLLMIVNLDTFMKYYNIQYFEFYIKEDNNGLISDIENELAGNNYITITDQKKSIEDENNNYYQSIVMYISIFVLSLICIFINLNMMNIYDIDSRKHEFALMKILGISKVSQKIITCYEVCFVYIMGLLLGMVETKILVIILYNNLVIESDKISIIIYLLCSLTTFICVVSSDFLVNRKINKIQMISDLNINL